MKRNTITNTLAVMGLISSVTLATHVYGAAFQLFDQDASQLGNDYAGSLASANTPGTEYYNSAGMTHIKTPELSFGATAIQTNIEFNGRTVVNNIPTPPSQTTSQGGGLSVVPNFHLVLPMWDHWVAGFGVTVPFGLQTYYPSYSSAANAATQTSLQVINLGLSFARPITSWMSFGFGVDQQHASGVFDQSPTILWVHKELHNELSDWSPGWHSSLLFDLNKNTRIGLNYRSKVNHKPQGSSTVVTDSAGSSSDGNVSTQIVLPAVTSLGIYSDLSSRWTAMAKVDYTQWSTIQQIVLKNVDTGVPDQYQNVALPENFRNTWNFATGLGYRFSSQWLLNLGVGYDQTPVNTANRNLRLPDNNHYLLATGINYQANKNLALDLGYMHVFMKRADINNTATKITGGLNVNILEQGTVDASADVVGAQITWKFA